MPEDPIGHQLFGQRRAALNLPNRGVRSAEHEGVGLHEVRDLVGQKRRVVVKGPLLRPGLSEHAVGVWDASEKDLGLIAGGALVGRIEIAKHNPSADV